MRHPFGLRSLLASLAALTMTALSSAQSVIELWPEGVPGLNADLGPERYDAAKGSVANVSHPTLAVYRPEHPNGTAVVVCPGGGYTGLAYPKEGIEPAEWFVRHGVTAFVLKYRLREYGQPAPLRDVLRALRTVRSQAKHYGIAADRIGIMGFSAGGHLAGSAGTLFDDPLGRTGAALDRVSARPDFMMLIYPVITMEDPFVHPGSRLALLGAHPSSELKAHWSLEQQVTAHTAPAFLVATEEDEIVPVSNTLMFYEALAKAGVPAEMHIFQKGAHGYALRLKAGPTSHWPDLALEWMTSHGWLPAPAPTPAAG